MNNINNSPEATHAPDASFYRIRGQLVLSEEKTRTKFFITSSSLGDDNAELSGLYSIRLQDEGLPENKVNWNKLYCPKS